MGQARDNDDKPILGADANSRSMFSFSANELNNGGSAVLGMKFARHSVMKNYGGVSCHTFCRPGFVVVRALTRPM
jgi:hypothetical protein